ncbi:hypothetical protein [Streptomyces flaveolus]
MSTDRTKIVIAALGAAFAVSVGVQAPHLIPALTLGLAAWIAVCTFLKL